MAQVPRIVPLKTLSTHDHAEVSLALLTGTGGAAATPCVVHHLTEPRGLAALPAEMRAAGQRIIGLEHGNIVRTLSVEVIEGRAAVVTEYVRGASLAEVLGACRGLGLEFTAAMAAFVTREAARGLAHAHARMPHGSLSPEALLVSVEGEVKATDFAFALVAAQGGTPWGGTGRRRYAAPELLRGEPPSAACDVFSIGMILKDALDWGEKHESLPSELQGVVARCSAIQIDGRYASASELDRALTVYLGNHHPDFIPKKMGTFVETMLAEAIEKRAILIRDGVTRGATNIGAPLGTNAGAFAPGPGEVGRADTSLGEPSFRPEVATRGDGTYRPEAGSRPDPGYRPAVVGGRISHTPGREPSPDVRSILKWGVILVSLAVLAYAVLDHLRR